MRSFNSPTTTSRNILFLLTVTPILAAVGFSCPRPTHAQRAEIPETRNDRAGASPLFARDNLVAWCIVPFDGKKRTPAERAAMCARLGLKQIAYDWRAEHVATFEQEILEYRKHGLDYFAFWGEHADAFRLFEKYDLHPQIWYMFATPDAVTQQDRVKMAAERLLPLVERTRAMGSKLGLYNHGGWSGEPENMVAVCEYLREKHNAEHVGIVYNLHHAHGRIDDFKAVLELLKPYLLCLNLNGMTRDGDKRDQKILPLGEGEFDVALLRAIRDSGYGGPIGIIGHTQDDVEQRLQDNLDGLDWILPQLEGKPAGPKPALRTSRPKANAPLPENVRRTVLDGSAEYREPREYSKQLVDHLLQGAEDHGSATRGLIAFSNAKAACTGCHKLGMHGGTVGPDLTRVGTQLKPEEIVESVLWPAKKVKPEYVAHQVFSDDGRSHRGYIVSQTADEIELRDPTKGPEHRLVIPRSDVEFSREIGTLMPDNLAAVLNEQQLIDVLRLLIHQGREGGLPIDDVNSVLHHAVAHQHTPASFPFELKPLRPGDWPHWQHFVNRDRIYDFYSKQADYFRAQAKTGQPAPALLAEFPGIDGGTLGHWGNQNDQDTWADDLWNETDRGTLLSGVFRAAGKTVPRGVCVRVGENGEMACCFNPDSLAYEAVWKGGFVKTSSVRHGFMDGLRPVGELVPLSNTADTPKTGAALKYHGFYRVGKRVVFAYRVGNIEYLDSPWMEDGQFVRNVGPMATHPMRTAVLQGGRFSMQWPQELKTPIVLGSASPYTVDTIKMPFDNPWKALMYAGGLGFRADGSALVCTMQGDVWMVSGFEYPSQTATWKRFASGLHHALGLVADSDGVFVVGRDQITRLHDYNNDGEADFYECFSNAYQTSPAGHDFICGLVRDDAGYFYTASGNQGIVRVSPDGERAEVVATGFRNPDGLGLTSDGMITVPCSEGEWTPATMICGFCPDQEAIGSKAPFFGYPGPRGEQIPCLPLAYLPRGLDNSAGAQVTVTSDRWGPLQGQLLHFSFGTGSHFLVLRDDVDGQLQGAVVPLPGEFASGAHRGAFNPTDGQLYVSGMQGWGSYTPDTGSFQRVRYVGPPVRFPVGFQVFENGVLLQFSNPVEDAVAAVADNHFAQCWNYRYSQAYGSPEFSTAHYGMRGHDTLEIRSAKVMDGGRSLFLEIPQLQPVSQLHLRLRTGAIEFRDLFITVHRLRREQFLSAPGLEPIEKEIEPHPMITDLAMATRSVPNPHTKPIDGARAITIETGTNLSYKTRVFQVKAGETIALTLANPDVVPHNLAIAKPGTLQRVGRMTNQLVSDPDAAFRHYIPETDDVLVYTDVVLPKEEFTIYFRAPEAPGTYPYLCTFPGHWPVMNGEMIVKP